MYAVNHKSRFNGYNPITFKGQTTFGFYFRPAFLEKGYTSNQVGYHTVDITEEGRPDRIAEKLYGSAEYEWVLLLLNDVSETLTWPTSGQLIKYLSRQYVLANV